MWLNSASHYTTVWRCKINRLILHSTGSLYQRRVVAEQMLTNEHFTLQEKWVCPLNDYQPVFDLNCISTFVSCLSLFADSLQGVCARWPGGVFRSAGSSSEGTLGGDQFTQEHISRGEKCGATCAADGAGDDLPILHTGSGSGGKHVYQDVLEKVRRTCQECRCRGGNVGRSRLKYLKKYWTN